MAHPVDFEESNAVLTKPEDMTEEECGDLPICRVQDGRIISCWELTDDELMEILQTKRVWLSVWSGATQPPVCVQGETPFIMKK